MKLLKFSNNEKNFKKLSNKEDVKKALYLKFKACKASRLYNFFISVVSVGYDEIKKCTDDSTFYRNINELKGIGVDFSQSSFEDVLKIDFDNVVNFNPFLAEEVI